METHPNATNSQVQQVVAGISAQLAQLAKNPPDLTAYLRAHANLLNQALRPQGLTYEILSGNSFKRLFSVNLKQLKLDENPAQDESFRKAVNEVAAGKKPMVFPPGSRSKDGSENLAIDTAVTSERLTLFNDTPFEQFFIPIPMESKVAGVLHAWFKPVNNDTTKTRLLLLKHFCEEIVLYFRSRRADDLTQEITRVNTYSHLLEDLAGDIDLDSVAWNIVNFARETVDCERVSIFNVKDFPNQNGHGLEFEILACSGLKRPHARSEHAEILKDLVRELAIFTLSDTETMQKQKVETANSTVTPQIVEQTAEQSEKGKAVLRAPGLKDQSKEKSKETEKPSLTLPSGDRPKFHLTFTYRDPEKVASRPEAINQYFDSIPMNWATSLPLFDREGLVCGILLFEGRDNEEKAKSTFIHMRDLAYSGGRSLGTSLYWNKRRSFKVIKEIARLKTRYVNTDKRKLMLKVGLPIVIALLILCLPFKFKIRGDTFLRPTKFQSLPSMVSARLDKVFVREGQSVNEGDILAVLESRDLKLQLLQAQQDYQRYIAVSDMARNMGDETQMQISQLNARKSAATIDKLRYEIAHAEVRAPFSGIVIGPSNLQMRVGDVLKVGEPVVEMAKPGNWEVKIDVREQDLVFLERFMSKHDTVTSEVKFNADLTKTYTLELNDTDQLAYGLETGNGDYSFAVVLPMDESIDSENLKMGYTGNAAFIIGRRPLAYIMFRDVVHFFRVRWF